MPTVAPRDTQTATLFTSLPTALVATQYPQSGDVVLYPAKPGDWTDALIARGTGGPYVHCGVVEQVEVSPGDGARQVTTIEALTHGVTRVTYPLYALAGQTRTPTFAPVASHLESARRAWALAWLGRRVGEHYGWSAIAADVLKALIPQRMGSRTPFLVSPSSLDCSQLVTEYLLTAGYQWLPDSAIASPPTVSPNDVARILGVLRP